VTELRFYVPLNTKQVITETFPKAISCLGVEKLNLYNKSAHPPIKEMSKNTK